MFRDFKLYYKSLDKFKKGFWIYIFLIFIEGAMRKWFMTGLSNVWMMCREPIVIWTVLSLMSTKYLRSAVAKAFMFIGCITFLTTMIFGHHNLGVALFGFRIWFFHIPYIFIMSQKLNRYDLMKVCQCLIFVFLPMTVLYVMQWAAPPSSWLNASIGGIVGEEGAQAIYGAVRPSGTFAHCVASSYYNPIVICLFCAVIFSKYYKEQFLTFKKGYPIFLIAVLICLITSVSRGAIIQSVLTIVLIAFFLAFTGRTKFIGRIVAGFVSIYILLAILSTVSIGGKNLMAPVADRFESAAEQEGGTSGIMESRILEPYKFWNNKGKLLEPPSFGYGIGAGSNFGTQTLHLKGDFGDSKAWGLGEWSSQIVTNEMGFLFGGIVFFLRIGLCISLFFASIRKLFHHNDILPLSLWTLSVTYFGNGNINLTMTLGWIVILMILLLTSIKTSSKICN